MSWVNVNEFGIVFLNMKHKRLIVGCAISMFVVYFVIFCFQNDMYVISDKFEKSVVFFQKMYIPMLNMLALVLQLKLSYFIPFRKHRLTVLRFLTRCAKLNMR